MHPIIKAYEEVKVIDDLTVQIVTKHPIRCSFPYVAQKYMVPIEYTKRTISKPWHQTRGTGPYVLKSWMKGGELVLAAKADYYKGAPKIDEVVFRPIPEDSTRIAELLVGNVDIIANLKPDNVEEVQSTENLSVNFVPAPGWPCCLSTPKWINSRTNECARQSLRTGCALPGQECHGPATLPRFLPWLRKISWAGIRKESSMTSTWIRRKSCWPKPDIRMVSKHHTHSPRPVSERRPGLRSHCRDAEQSRNQNQSRSG